MAALAISGFFQVSPTPLFSFQGGLSWRSSRHFCLPPSPKGGIGPAIYELSAELLYPVPEATSGGLMVLLINIATLIFLFVSPLITTTWINTIQMLTMVGCFVMVHIHPTYPQAYLPKKAHSLTGRACQVVFVNERYKRWEAEMAIYHEKPQLSHPPPPLGLNVQE